MAKPWLRPNNTPSPGVTKLWPALWLPLWMLGARLPFPCPGVVPQFRAQLLLMKSPWLQRKSLQADT